MATQKELYEQMMRQREAEAVAADGANRRARVLTVLVCLAWCAAGGGVMAWGLMTYDVSAGRLALSAGPAIATAGTIFTLLYAYTQAEKRGDR